MTNSTYIASRHLVATNGADYNETTDAIALRHMQEAEDFFAAHPELAKADAEDKAITSYGAEYFCEVGGDFDEDGEYDVAATVEAHDLSTDDLDHIEAHGIYNLSDIQAYRPIGTGTQSKRARDLVLMDTRDETIRELRADRAAQLQRHLTGERQTRGERIVAGKQSAAERRELIRERNAKKRAKAKARAAKARAQKLTPRFTDAESNAARADRAAERKLDDYLNQ